jgi:hypothetical protein
VGLLLASSRAEATSQQGVALAYEVDPTLVCPSVTDFRGILAQQLGYDPHRVDATSAVRVRVRPTEDGIEGLIDWSTPTEKHVGERRFESRSDECKRLIATVGFVVAVQLQLRAAEDTEELDSDGVSDPSRPNRGITDESGQMNERIPQVAQLTLTAKSFEAPRSTAPNAMSRALMGGLGPAIGLGLGPDPVALGRLFVAARRGWLGMEIGIERTLPSTNTESYGGGFEHAWTLGTLATCGWHGSAFACGVAKLGSLHVDGFGVDRPAAPNGFVMQIGPRVGYSLPLGDYILLLGRVEALYLLTPWTVDLNHVAVWSTPRMSALAGIDVAARFQ